MMEWMAEFSPCIPVAASSIQVLYSPNEYFRTLKKLVSTSQKRVVLACLFLDAGDLEQELVDSLRNAIETKGSQFKVRVLLDCLRGTRGGGSTGMLQDLVNEHWDDGKMQVHLYHTPELRGLLKRVLPERFNEMIGVQHMKLYIFDDSLLISGANLSESYFTNRQDRYILFNNCPALADFYIQIVNAVARSSFLLGINGKIVLHDHCRVHPYHGSYNEFRTMFQERIMNIVDHFKKEFPVSNARTSDTVIYPLVQMAQIGIDIEDRVLQKLLSNCHKDICFATGYFNLTGTYSSLILERDNCSLTILSASPRANDFFFADGFTGDVPALYTHAQQMFHSRAVKAGRIEDIRLCEWARDDWTFHGKGLWWEADVSATDSIAVTFIGSSNYGYRSVSRDLEAQVVIVTKDVLLKRKLRQERANLFEHATDVTFATFKDADHRVALWIRLIYRFIRSFF